MAMNTPYLSENTTHFTSNVTIDGALTVGGVQTFSGTVASASAASFGALTASTGNFNSTLSARGALSVNGLGPMQLVSLSSTTIVATTVVATKSTSTTFTDNAVAIGDLIEVGPSNLSNGVILQAYCSTASSITFNYSNVSAANAAQVAINCRYLVWRF